MSSIIIVNYVLEKVLWKHSVALQCVLKDSSNFECARVHIGPSVVAHLQFDLLSSDVVSLSKIAMKPTTGLLGRSAWKGTLYSFWCPTTSSSAMLTYQQAPISFREQLQTPTFARSLSFPFSRPPPPQSFPKIIADIISTIHSLPIVRPKAGEKIVPIKTQARSATILPNFVGLKFQVHNGKIYHDVIVTEAMVGHKLGEFSP